MEAAVPDARLRRAEGPAADPQVASADDAGAGGRADQGPGAGASGLWLQPARGDAGAGRHPRFGDHHPILNDNGLGTRVGRWLALEAKNADKAIAITPEQAAFLETLNPCFRERHVESAAPGELLSADTFFVGSLKGVGKVYLHAVVDTYGSYAFGFLHDSKQAEAAVAVLHNDVLPFYINLDLPVGAVLTDNGREFYGTENHPYELYLDLDGIEYRRTKVRTPKTNGFVERFNGTVLDEFFRVKLRDNFYDRVEALRADLDAWLVHYNTERPHLGYRNMGKRPIETVMAFVSQEG